MNNLLLIDALNLIRRIYAVNEPKEIKQHEAHIKACCQRVEQAARSLLRKTAATHAVAVFDGDKSWRYHFYPNYKMNRQPMPERLSHSLELFSQAFASAGVKSFNPAHDEADDIIATLASKAANANVNTTIVSTDKGFLPLISDTITVYDYFKKSVISTEDIKSRFSVTQNKLELFWALSGDKTNDIPGVAGIGVKTAQELLSKHDSFDEMLEDQTLKPSVNAKLKAGAENYITSLALVTLRKDIEIGFSLKDIRVM
ncbi:flap endonuclease Xni [Pseudoalteromonas piscicida]|uniref:Flap endonuclease Xni n=1 Tax=Pseudoalteromonas piscicida TaxID=43662 RepID=A0A2A5JMA0_PSEO7|nr:flap endonuclease Xni [Pseudoalteromonas piscicida]PCK30487.1 flap endonuclease Xni [Pseudoalteromonas piscicida]